MNLEIETVLVENYYGILEPESSITLDKRNFIKATYDLFLFEYNCITLAYHGVLSKNKIKNPEHAIRVLKKDGQKIHQKIKYGTQDYYENGFWFIDLADRLSKYVMKNEFVIQTELGKLILLEEIASELTSIPPTGVTYKVKLVQ